MRRFRITVYRLLCAGVLLALLAGSGVQAQTTDPVDRAMYFIERSTEATELLNCQKFEEALAIFKELATYSDQDTDGYVAAAIGDCLAGLNRPAEARTAYDRALAAHPDLKESLNRKIAELDVIGEVSEEGLARLRAAAPGNSAAQWRLARGLQQRARALLSEAAAAFRNAAEAGNPMAMEGTTQATLLDDVVQELGKLVSHRDVLDINKAIREKADRWEPQRQQMEQVLRRGDGRSYDIQIHREGNQSPVISVNAQPLQLNCEQLRLLQIYQDRINAVLLQAADDMAKSDTTQH